MTEVQLIDRKISKLKQNISKYRSKVSEHPTYDFVVKKWEESLIDALSRRDLKTNTKEEVNLRIEVDGGEATGGELSYISMEVIKGHLSKLLNLVSRSFQDQQNVIKLEIVDVKNCCTLMTFNPKGTENISMLEAYNKSASYLVNAFLLIEKESKNLDVVYLNNEMKYEIKNLLLFLESNNFDFKIIADFGERSNIAKYDLSFIRSILEPGASSHIS